ncbi:tRNA (adenosine(37)-N6)-threonylcarbamoyltransferase complex transferase subunit TsaD [Candidatus Saccharibacteria bacterium]|nr:tRNA (adenosine(37)-N6)-threonylcarbamoyltransferase complex transferase subunit TsaD [Candidatus Saccharibacteria bacterium]MBH1973178.1 tRNA (adenosine(37)-N6)-threonylcarbamoyltransferase complex transferase subunit TsaD [Candidatus Saccharibacteria bacterium]MBH1990581.1 tRNA (adenosine(37)-N6)-threonylcarbamoyltransferase complex transferase subunit TsaD [Candidatus Saccharibacteria bacterium]
MKILGIESSCDETAASVVEDGTRLLSNVVHTQIDIHAEYGGVVPEIAARSHIEVVNPVIKHALDEAQLTWDDIDAIAVTYAPGLVGSLLVGTLAARTIALLKHKPLYPIHHVEAHVYANFITQQADTLSLTLPNRQPEFPMLALIVSGGHSQLALFRDHGDYELLGQTQDDAVGEAFDKVAKIIGLPYPGGPSIANAALQGDPKRYQLPKAKLSGEYDFSFSGLKTAVLRAVQREVGVDFTFPSHELPALVNDVQRADFAASFQSIAVETLVDKAQRAYRDYAPKSVVIAGGVAANQELRRQLSERLPLDIQYAPMQLCTDNAAMIATLGYYYAQKNHPTSPLELEVIPSLSMTKTAWA